MTTRRGFFKQFIGQVGALRDEAKGIDKIPLNRLNELPDKIIEEIEPVLFSQTDWSLSKNVISRLGKKEAENKEVVLDDLELQIFQHFRGNRKLKWIAESITEKDENEFDFFYEKVTSLFFKLASMRVCHPAAVYNIDELKKTSQQQEHEDF